MGNKRIGAIIGFVLISVILVNPIYLNAFAQSQKIPVIILFKEKVTGEDNNQVQSNGGEITRTYHIINGLAVKLPQNKIEVIKNDPRVASVDLDVEVHALDLSADTQIRADQVWGTGDTGTGIPVAILDTGIDTTHPEFSGRILKCHSEITNTNTCTDGNGHGTHTAGIAGAAGVNPSAKGVAPAVSLYSDQVLDSTGGGTISGVIAGIDWATANSAKVISMSLGTSPLATSQPNCDTAIPSLTTSINNAVATPSPPPPPDFSLSASPSSVTVQQGGTGSSTITVSSLNGFSSAVGLTVSAPPGVTASVSPTSVTPAAGGSATSALSISVPSSTATGSYTITVTGASGSLTHTTTISLTVSAPPPPPPPPSEED